MKVCCKIEQANLKIWSRVITSLTSVGGDNVHFAFTHTSVVLTVFDGALSVNLSATLLPVFFAKYDVPRNYSKSFSLPSKCVLKPFNTSKFIGKSVTFVEFQFEDNCDNVTVTVGCKSLAEMKYVIKMTEDDEEIQPEVDIDKLENWVKTDAKVMISSLSNFPKGKGMHDITIQTEMGGNKMVFKNCATDLMRKESKIYTEISVGTAAFDTVCLVTACEITITLRDFRTFINFADTLKVPVTLHFQSAQDPVVASIKSSSIEARLMLAPKVVDDMDEVSNSQQSAASSTAISSANSNNEPPSRKGQQSAPTTKKKTPPPKTVQKPPAAVEVEIGPPEVEFLQPPPPPVPFASSRPQKRKTRADPVEKTNKEGDREDDVENRAVKRISKEQRENMKKLWARMNATPKRLQERFPGIDDVVCAASDDEETSDSET